MFERLMLLVVMLLDTTNLGAVTFPVVPGSNTMFPALVTDCSTTLLLLPNANSPIELALTFQLLLVPLLIPLLFERAWLDILTD